MAGQTVREEMAEALERLRQKHYHTCKDFACMVCVIDAALARHRAEPEGHCACDGYDCPTWKAGHDEGYQEGLEAQRERDVVDVRFQPYSRNPDFRSAALRSHL